MILVVHAEAVNKRQCISSCRIQNPLVEMIGDKL